MRKLFSLIFSIHKLWCQHIEPYTAFFVPLPIKVFGYISLTGSIVYSKIILLHDIVGKFLNINEPKINLFVSAIIVATIIAIFYRFIIIIISIFHYIIENSWPIQLSNQDIELLTGAVYNKQDNSLDFNTFKSSDLRGNYMLNFHGIMFHNNNVRNMNLAINRNQYINSRLLLPECATKIMIRFDLSFATSTDEKDIESIESNRGIIYKNYNQVDKTEYKIFIKVKNM